MTQVVAAIIRKDGKILACRRPAHKKRGLLWEFAGGKVEEGETCEQALARECREELGVTISVGVLFAEKVHAYEDVTVHLYFYETEIVGGEPKKLEHDEIRFVLPEELGGLPFCPADNDIIEKLQGE